MLEQGRQNSGKNIAALIRTLKNIIALVNHCGVPWHERYFESGRYPGWIKKELEVSSASGLDHTVASVAEVGFVST